MLPGVTALVGTNPLPSQWLLHPSLPCSQPAPLLPFSLRTSSAPPARPRSLLSRSPEDLSVPQSMPEPVPSLGLKDILPVSLPLPRHPCLSSLFKHSHQQLTLLPYVLKIPLDLDSSSSAILFLSSLPSKPLRGLVSALFPPSPKPAPGGLRSPAALQGRSIDPTLASQ